MPSKKTTSQPRRASKPRAPRAPKPAPTPAPSPTVEPTAAQPASFVIEQPAAPLAAPVVQGVDPALASIVVAPPVAPAEPVAQAAEPAPVVEVATDGATPAFPERIRLGHVECMLHRVPLGEVLLYLEAFEDRIATLRDSQAVIELQPRVLATEGRCAPIYFSADDDGEPEHLVAGVETVAAAMNLGLECVFVVTVDPGEVEGLHAQLIAELNKATADPDADLFARVASYHR